MAPGDRPRSRRRPRQLTLAAAALAGAGLLSCLPAAAQAPPAAGAGPTLTTTASPPVTRRGQITDTAVLAGAIDPTGTIAFDVYGPDDPTCTGPPAAHTTRPVTGNGSYVSAPYVVPMAGVYRFVAAYSGDAANAPVAAACGDPGEAVTVTNPPAPVLGRSFQVGPLTGTIRYALPAVVARLSLAHAAKGLGFTPLRESRTLPVGSVIDATGGVARITSAAGGAGKVQVGDFGAGEFKVLQDRRARGLTQLDLMIGRSIAQACPPAAVAGRARTAAVRPRLSAKVLALLRANVAGSFRTRGRFSSATVRGTNWDTVDRCDGTLTRVHRGSVVVADFRRARNIVVRTGRSYLARAPQP
ncbi:MAG: hypothetical protein QOE27_1731 [Solirubrobacteraceae bacterium]|nr:hypothetical protein [Solirubrobacteraceae bacterium]